MHKYLTYYQNFLAKLQFLFQGLIPEIRAESITNAEPVLTLDVSKEEAMELEKSQPARCVIEKSDSESVSDLTATEDEDKDGKQMDTEPANHDTRQVVRTVTQVRMCCQPGHCFYNVLALLLHLHCV